MREPLDDRTCYRVAGRLDDLDRYVRLLSFR